METEYITALEYATKHDRSKAWVIKLCHAKRLDGAYLAGGVWVIPADCPLPDPLRRGPKPSFDRAMAKLAMDQARVAREARRVEEHEQVERIGTALHPNCKAAIDHCTARGGVFNSAGSCKLGDRWLMSPEGWNGAAWLYAQSVAAGKPVLSAEPVAKDWPSNVAEFDRKEEIHEGVLGEPVKTLAEIKAICKVWGPHEQAYYDSLVAANPL